MIGFVAVCAQGLFAEGTESNTGATSIEQAFQDKSVAPINVGLVPEKDAPVMLQKLIVTDWWTKSKVKRSFETKPTPWLENVLHWHGKKWGTKDYGPVRVDFGTWFQFGEKETGAIKERDIYIKLELVRLRW